MCTRITSLVHIADWKHHRVLQQKIHSDMQASPSGRRSYADKPFGWFIYVNLIVFVLLLACITLVTLYSRNTLDSDALVLDVGYWRRCRCGFISCADGRNRNSCESVHSETICPKHHREPSAPRALPGPTAVPVIVIRAPTMTVSV
jgi:hypothetical protein